MSPYRRNVLLGVTVIFALGVLVWMMLKFAGSAATVFGPSTMRVSFITERADGVADGSPINYLGLECGHATAVRLDPDRKHIHIQAQINKEPALPANVVGLIKTASLLGSGSAITLEAQGEPSSEKLKENQVIAARFVGLGEVLPTQFGELASEMNATIKQIRESNIINDLDEQVKNAGKLITSMQDVIGDPKTQSDLKKSIANMTEVTESAKALAGKLDKLADDVQKTNAQANTTIARSGENIESVSRQMGDRLTQVAKLLEQFQSIAEKVEKGQGTAGALVNDPKLYESLVDTARELNATIKDLKRLAEQWEQEGVTLKLK